MSFGQLAELTPFKWVDGENDGLMVASPEDIGDLMIRTPVDGWQSVRESPPLNSHLSG